MASTAATHPTAAARCSPAPIKRLPSARPSGILWMHRAENSDHFAAPVAGSFALDSQSQTVSRAVNCQGDDQRGSDFAEMLSGISVEMTGRASRANMMDMFADEKEKRVAGDLAPATPPTMGTRQNSRARSQRLLRPEAFRPRN